MTMIITSNFFLEDGEEVSMGWETIPGSDNAWKAFFLDVETGDREVYDEVLTSDVFDLLADPVI